ncbi:MAG: hypothetical protein AVDCRST_MAG59-2249, partial [uncultured Thermomicrobiales bacterium]
VPLPASTLARGRRRLARRGDDPAAPPSVRGGANRGRQGAGDDPVLDPRPELHRLLHRPRRRADRVARLAVRLRAEHHPGPQRRHHHQGRRRLLRRPRHPGHRRHRDLPVLPLHAARRRRADPARPDRPRRRAARPILREPLGALHGRRPRLRRRVRLPPLRLLLPPGSPRRVRGRNAARDLGPGDADRARGRRPPGQGDGRDLDDRRPGRRRHHPVRVALPAARRHLLRRRRQPDARHPRGGRGCRAPRHRPPGGDDPRPDRLLRGARRRRDAAGRDRRLLHAGLVRDLRPAADRARPGRAVADPAAAGLRRRRQPDERLGRHRLRRLPRFARGRGHLGAPALRLPDPRRPDQAVAGDQVPADDGRGLGRPRPDRPRPVPRRPGGGPGLQGAGADRPDPVPEPLLEPAHRGVGGPTGRALQRPHLAGRRDQERGGGDPGGDGV